MLGISLGTWLLIAAMVIAAMIAIGIDKKKTQEDRRKYREEVRESERKQQAALREILARRLAEDDSPQESAR